MTANKLPLIGLTREELESFAESLGEPPYRGRQLHGWLYARRVRSFDEMTDLPTMLRGRLAETAEITRFGISRQSTSPDGTTKYLFDLPDGLKIESVFLPESPGMTVCISSQVGCAMGCRFCATGKMGLFRNLSAGEIVTQVMEVEQLANTRITNVVFMGMGEPLHNYDQVIKAVQILTDKGGMALPSSRITVSTVGIVPMIERWCSENPPAKLAISLHATTDERRNQIVPLGKAYPLDMLFKSLRKLAHVTKYHVTFEYIMIAGLNDRKDDAFNLQRLLRNIPARVNLIRLHPTDSGLKPSSDTAIDRFMGWLTDCGVTCTLRESRGVEDSAACGMLFTQEPFRPTKARAWEHARQP